MKAAGLLLIGLALVAASLFAARTGDDILLRGVGWFGTAFFGLATLKAIRDLFSTDTAYVFDDRGIDDRLSGIGLIPWSAITAVQQASVRGTRFILLSLDQPQTYLSRLSALKRGLAAVNKDIGFGDWTLAFVGITPGVDEAWAYIQDRLAKSSFR